MRGVLEVGRWMINNIVEGTIFGSVFAKKLLEERCPRVS